MTRGRVRATRRSKLGSRGEGVKLVPNWAERKNTAEEVSLSKTDGDQHGNEWRRVEGLKCEPSLAQKMKECNRRSALSSNLRHKTL